MAAIEIIKDVIVKAPQYLGAVSAVLTALIGLFMLIPSDQPEKSLQKVVDFISKFSKK